MWKVIKRRWKYLTAKLSGRFEETADPKVQLEQAMVEAQDQHRRLVEQAASVIANQKQTELQLNRSMQELERISGTTRQALTMADDAARRGDTAKAAEYNQTAQAFANRLIATEKRVEDLKTMHLQAAQAADQARSAVAQNASLLQQKLAERQKLLSQLDQTRMQEQLNTAMASLSQTVDQDVPTFDDVRAKIEAQYAKALGTAELSGQSVESAHARGGAGWCQLGGADAPGADAPADGATRRRPGQRRPAARLVPSGPGSGQPTYGRPGDGGGCRQCPGREGRGSGGANGGPASGAGRGHRSGDRLSDRRLTSVAETR